MDDGSQSQGPRRKPIGMPELAAAVDEAVAGVAVDLDAWGEPVGSGIESVPEWTAGTVSGGGEKVSLFGKGGTLLARVAALAVADAVPVAVAMEGATPRLMVYRDGVYRRDDAGVARLCYELMGDRFRPAHVAVVREALAAECLAAGRVIVPFGHEGWVCVRNGMLHVASGRFRAHDPSWYCAVQLTVNWNPKASCEYYMQWAEKQIGLDHLPALEEASAAFLAPAVVDVPMRTLFLYGPSRSGKGTWLRLLESLVDADMRAGVALAQLTTNRFMAAQLHGKILNVSGDLSARHVEDLSVWKMLTGDDLVTAEHKGGQPFSFRWKGLMAFSANEIPTVSESSGAYVNRMAPFKFGVSFEGAESRAVERRLMREADGIFVRWVAAVRALCERGEYLPREAAVEREFRGASDRVAQWVEDHCVVWTMRERQRAYDDDQVTPGRALHREFMSYAREGNGRTAMRERHFIARLELMPGVEYVRSQPTRVRGYNVTVKEDGVEYSGMSESEEVGDGVGAEGQTGQTRSRYRRVTGSRRRAVG